MNYFNISRATQGLVAYLKEHLAGQRPGRPQHLHRARHPPFLAPLRGALREGGRGKRLRRAALRGAALDAGAFLRRAPHGLGRRHRHHRQPQSAARQRLQMLLLGRRAGRRAARQRHHREGERHRVRRLRRPCRKRSSGTCTSSARKLDEAYMRRLETLILDPAMVARAERACASSYTPIHGTGGVIIKPMLERLGFQAIHRAGAGCLRRPLPHRQIAKPGKRRGPADGHGTGGPGRRRPRHRHRSRLRPHGRGRARCRGPAPAAHRQPDRLAHGLVSRPHTSSSRASSRRRTRRAASSSRPSSPPTCKKPSPSASACAASRRSPASNTSAQKLGKYERRDPRRRPRGLPHLPEDETRRLRLEYSSFYVFGGEESYGYSGADFVRDKDGNGAAVMFAEVAAYAKSRGLTLAGALR